MLEMATRSLNIGLGAFAHILNCVAQLLRWKGRCNVLHALLLFWNQLWLNASNLVPNEFPNKGVKRIEIRTVWWQAVPQRRLMGDDPSTKLFDEKVDVEVGRVICRSVLHEPVILAAGSVPDLWPEMPLQHHLIPL